MSAYTQTLRIWMTATLMNSGTLKWSMPFGVTKRISNILYIIAESMRCTRVYHAIGNGPPNTMLCTGTRVSK